MILHRIYIEFGLKRRFSSRDLYWLSPSQSGKVFEVILRRGFLIAAVAIASATISSAMISPVSASALRVGYSGGEPTMFPAVAH